MKDLLVILRRNFLQPIVIAILVLSGILLALNESRDAFFISFVIVINTLFGVVQEIRARNALRKLELMSAPRARRQTSDGSFEEIMFDQLVVGDIIRLHTGDEIPADGEIVDSTGLEADESMLTGETASVEKEVGATAYAASAIVAGTALMRVTAVGADTKAGSMTATLKRYTPQPTPLQRAIARAITILTWGALILAGLIAAVYFFSGQDVASIFKTITAAAITIVPEGLLLASSLLLAFGSLRLAQAKVLPQKLGAIEAMALLNVLCVDKTGTLTTDHVSFEELVLFDKKADTTLWKKLVAIIAKETSSGNATGDAIIAALKTPKGYKIVDTLAFSSERKMSGNRFTLDGNTHTVIMGAPEFVARLAPLSAEQKLEVEKRAQEGQRVLLVAAVDDAKTPLKKLADNTGTAIGLIVLSNALRDGVEKTVAYLQKNGVSMRVISGDNPSTVRYIAGKAGIKNPDKIITGAQLSELSDVEWDKIVLQTTIFARVLPEQKERLIATFKKHGNFTGMVGDGVNDALALKKADLGVAMYAGAVASRRVADIVLLNNSFTSLPMGMKLGNRIMQAIEVISVLFFHKIIYSVSVLLITLMASLQYPFLPRHMTFMNIFMVTLPTIMWTLFPPRPRHRVQPQHFWRDTLIAVLPIGLLSGVAVTATYWLGMNASGGQHHRDVATMTVLVATFFGVHLVFLASKMLGVVYDKTARIARLLYVGAVIVVAYLSFGFTITREFFDFSKPEFSYLLPSLVIIIVTVILQQIIARRVGKKLVDVHYKVDRT